MFDGLKNLANLPALMSKAREMQDRMKKMQEELGARQVSSDSGAGAVTAIVNGRLELIRVRIDKSRVDVNDVEMLEDLVTAAVNAAQAKAARMMQDEMGKLASEVGLPPGMLG
jgi:DNA-binding YbaB/EbfC family protein